MKPWHIFASLMVAGIVLNASAMIKEVLDESKAPVVQAQLKNKKIHSLKSLTSKKLINYFDPSCNTHTLEKLKALRDSLSKLPLEMQNNLFKTILKEKPALLEQILNAQPIELTSWDAHSAVISPDSKFLFMRARRKQSADEPYYLIKVNTQTLQQEELINVKNCGISFNSQCNEIALARLKDNETKFCVSLYNLATKQSKLLLEGTCQAVPFGHLKPFPQVIFNADNSSVIIYHQGKSSIVNTNTAQVCGPVLDGAARPLDATRIMLYKPHNLIEIVSMQDGKSLFTVEHQPATHCQCLAADDLHKNHLYTVCDKKLTIYNLRDGQLLKQISFDRPLSGIDTSCKKLRVALMKEEFSHDVAEVDLETSTYTICAQNQSMPESMASCRANLSSDSLFHVDKCMQSRGIKLLDSNNKSIHKTSLQKMRPLDHRISYPHVSPDNSFVYADTALDGNRGTHRCTYIGLRTHRTLTNNTPLKDILTLLMLERQKQKLEKRDGQLWGDLLESANPLLRTLADTRYVNTWQETLSKYLAGFDTA